METKGLTVTFRQHIGISPESHDWNLMNVKYFFPSSFEEPVTRTVRSSRQMIALL